MCTFCSVFIPSPIQVQDIRVMLADCTARNVELENQNLFEIDRSRSIQVTNIDLRRQVKELTTQLKAKSLDLNRLKTFEHDNAHVRANLSTITNQFRDLTNHHDLCEKRIADIKKRLEEQEKKIEFNDKIIAAQLEELKKRDRIILHIRKRKSMED